MSIVILVIIEWILENHLLQKTNQMVSCDFIYDLVAPYYPANGRPSVDPVSMFKILLWDTFTVSSQNAGWLRKYS